MVPMCHVYSFILKYLFRLPHVCTLFLQQLDFKTVFNFPSNQPSAGPYV